MRLYPPYIYVHTSMFVCTYVCTVRMYIRTQMRRYISTYDRMYVRRKFECLISQGSAAICLR